MRSFDFSTVQLFNRSPAELFPFFADAGNLMNITPPWLKFRILTPLPITMRRGAVIDYRLSWRAIPMGWRTEILQWQPPVYFVDEQIRGPYRKWRHEHIFEECDQGTRMTDRIEYAVPGGAWIERLFVGSDVRRIFAYRKEALAALFEDRSRGQVA